jgi:hypothetical protein|tara:strand:- start:4472 stop:4645 length:174 start_codon:yes stop_codon:yes gene_type:complete
MALVTSDETMTVVILDNEEAETLSKVLDALSVSASMIPANWPCLGQLKEAMASDRDA